MDAIEGRRLPYGRHYALYNRQRATTMSTRQLWQLYNGTIYNHWRMQRVQERPEDWKEHLVSTLQGLLSPIQRRLSLSQLRVCSKGRRL